MTNLHETQLRFNPKIKIKTDDVQLSNNAGLLFYAEFKHAAGLDQTIDQAAAQLSENVLALIILKLAYSIKCWN